MRGQIWGHETGMGHWSLTQHGHKKLRGPWRQGRARASSLGVWGQPGRLGAQMETQWCRRRMEVLLQGAGVYLEGLCLLVFVIFKNLLLIEG